MLPAACCVCSRCVHIPMTDDDNNVNVFLGDESLAADDSSRLSGVAFSSVSPNFQGSSEENQANGHAPASVDGGGAHGYSVESKIEKGNKATSTNCAYANAAKRRGLPTFKQSVVTDAIEGISNDVYLDQFEKIVPIENLLHFSKIDHNLVCFTLSSEVAASEMLFKTIKIKNRVLKFHPFVPGQSVFKYKRITISNIFPQIPNYTVIEQLEKIGIRTKNGITNIRCSSSNETRKHVLSHRRQFYVKEEDCDKIPPKLEIKFMETTFMISLGSEDIKCHYCKKSGHIAKYCSELLESRAKATTSQAHEHVSQTLTQGENSQLSESSVADSSFRLETQPEIVTHNSRKMEAASNDISEPRQKINDLDNDNINLKRTASFSDSSSNVEVKLGSETTGRSFKVPVNKGAIPKEKKSSDNAAKKFKVSQSVEVAASSDSECSDTGSGIDWFDVNNVSLELSALNVLYEKGDVTAPLDFNNLVKYFIEVKGKRNLVEFTESFTSDVPGLVTFLELACDLVNNANYRNRLRSLAKRLKIAIDTGLWPSKAPPIPTV